jgi:hypothetical protein
MADSQPQFMDNVKTLEITIDGKAKDSPVVSICGEVVSPHLLMFICRTGNDIQLVAETSSGGVL